jgi:competence ComEA-like helix-hairpin-helix protein
MSASAAPAPASDSRPPPWPRLAQLGLAFLLGALALLLLQYAWQRFGAPGRPTKVLDWPSAAEQYLRLDPNTAKREELLQIPGLGPVLAERIVRNREQHGPFQSVDELERVPGIGPILLDRLRPHLHLNAAPQLAATEGQLSHVGEAAKRLDLNRANRDELMTLPGIGPGLADRILADRQVHGPYRHVHDLTRIKGIKGKTLEKLLPHVYVKEAAVAKGRDGA